jgi:hypothetical protein
MGGGEMESLKVKRRAERKSKMRKAIIAISLAASLSVGTATFATNDELRAGLHNLLTAIVNPLLPEIDKELTSTGEQHAKQTEQHITEVTNAIPNTIDAYKKAEIERGKNELKQYFDEKIRGIDNTANAEINSSKAQIKSQTDQTIEKGKSIIDKVFDAYTPGKKPAP